MTKTLVPTNENEPVIREAVVKPSKSIQEEILEALDAIQSKQEEQDEKLEGIIDAQEELSQQIEEYRYESARGVSFRPSDGEDL